MAHSNQSADSPRDTFNELLRKHPLLARTLLLIAGFTITAVAARVIGLRSIAGIIAAYTIIITAVIFAFVVIPVHLLTYLD